MRGSSNDLRLALSCDRRINTKYASIRTVNYPTLLTFLWVSKLCSSTKHKLCKIKVPPSLQSDIIVNFKVVLFHYFNTPWSHCRVNCILFTNSNFFTDLSFEFGPPATIYSKALCLQLAFKTRKCCPVLNCMWCKYFVLKFTFCILVVQMDSTTINAIIKRDVEPMPSVSKILPGKVSLVFSKCTKILLNCLFLCRYNSLAFGISSLIWQIGSYQNFVSI